MSKFCLFFSLLFISNFSFAQKKSYQVSALAFYNFENFFDTIDNPKKFDEDFTPNGSYHYTSAVYKQKLHNIATVLMQLGKEITPDGPALIGTAEIENETVLNDLVNQPEIINQHYQFIIFNGPDSRGINCALLYNPKYFKVLNAASLNVNLDQIDNGHKTRDVLHVVGILSGDTTHVFVNHWPSRRGGEAASAPLRAIAASVSKKIIDSVMAVNSNSRFIVMGDLNDDPISPSVAKVLGAKGDKSKVEAGGLFNPFVSFYNQGIGTLGYGDVWNLFDQIMLSGNWLLPPSTNHWSYYKAEVFNRDFLKEKFGQYKGYPHRSFDGNNWINGYSDHFPSLIYLVKAL